MWKASLYNTTKVTLELREIVENGTDLWDFDYPSYYKGDEKTAFEKKVIDHYYFRQIGQETVGRFLHVFRSRIREIMPRYIDMYKTVEIMKNVEDPFGNVDITETFEQEATGSNQSTDTVNKTDKFTHRHLDTPQGSINNLDGHLTDASIDDSTGSGTNSTEGSSTGTVKHTLTRKGNQGVNTYAHDIIEFRQSIIDVDMMIIEDLNDLFLGSY